MFILFACALTGTLPLRQLTIPSTFVATETEIRELYTSVSVKQVLAVLHTRADCHLPVMQSLWQVTGIGVFIAAYIFCWTPCQWSVFGQWSSSKMATFSVLSINLYCTYFFFVIIYNFTEEYNISLPSCATLLLSIILFSVINSVCS